MSLRSKLRVWLADPSLFVAVPVTVLFYYVMFLPSMRGSVLAKHTTEHLVEYVIVFIFFWGLIDLLLKTAWLPVELLALRRPWLEPRTGRVPVDQAAGLLERVRSQPRGALSACIGRRLEQALLFVVENQSAQEFSDYLRYLADRDEERRHERYALVRFAVAVTPILGFLGTVVHFGAALGGLSTGNMEGELSHVVSEMGTAFNTTTVALGAAMSLMFAMFLCERMERGILQRVDRYAELELDNRFEVKDAEVVPFLAVLESAHREFQSAVQRSLDAQAESWSLALHRLFEQFDRRQAQDEVRWRALADELRERHAAHDASKDAGLQQLLSIADARQERHLAQVHDALVQAREFSGEVRALAATLEGIARGEGRLIELQSALADNLRVLNEANQIDAALHGLTAAIHLLTTRHQSPRHAA